MKCERCNGKGWIEQFKDINGGECLKCNGTGGGEFKLSRPKFNKISDEEALKNAFERINNERYEKRKEFLEFKIEEERKQKEHEEYLKNEFEKFEW